MTYEVIIGDPDRKQGTSALCVEGYPGISVNKQSFWIRSLILDLRMVVFRDTPEGKHLDQLIKDEVSRDEVMEYLNQLAISRLPYEKLKPAIETAIAKAHEAGRHAKVQGIFKVLDMRVG